MNRAETSSFRRKLTESGFYGKWKTAFGNEAWALRKALPENSLSVVGHIGATA